MTVVGVECYCFRPCAKAPLIAHARRFEFTGDAVTGLPASAPGTRICIVGMHRSGTSLVADLLQRAGLHLGPEWEILGAEPGNPRGHFENRRFTWINDRLLAAFGGAWYDSPALPGDWLHDARVAGPRRDARRILDSYSAERPFGWKDPRNTLLVPFWRDLVPGLRFIIVLRSPLAVAHSLGRRSGLALEQGSRLWFEYLRRAILDTRGVPRLFVDYDELLEDPQGGCARMAAFCALAPGAARRAADSVELALRHHESDEWGDLLAEGVVAEAKLLHVALGRLGMTRLDERAAEMDEALDAAVRAIDGLGDRARFEEKDIRVRELERALEDHELLRRQLAERDEALRVLRDLYGALEVRAHAGEEAARSLGEELARRDRSMAWRIVRTFWRWKDAALPPGTRRRRAWESVRDRLGGRTES